MTHLLTPANNAVVSLLTELQREFTAEATHRYNDANLDWAHLERTKDQDDTLPAPVIFSFESDQPESTFRLSTSPAMDHATVIVTQEQKLVLDNLFAGTKYYWQVNDSDIASFQTEFTYPRFLHIDGLTNVRDTGARKTQNGKVLKQGLLYRGSEMNLHHTITDAGKRVMLEDMKIKTDLDLRAEGVEHGCPLGDAVDWIVIPIAAYASFVTDYKKECKAIFDVLADKAHYPIYYHCWGGADRTGTVAALLGAILELSEADILLDYEITSLSIWGDRSRESELWQGLEQALMTYPGANFPERARAFLLDAGVSESQMEIIRSILLE
ncbi:MAG: tyrosine-protein phosphatase [Clostridia bacterium]|nr:tyrosine-protein phosphatase [Clostridia bacterium]